MTKFSEDWARIGGNVFPVNDLARDLDPLAPYVLVCGVACPENKRWREGLEARERAIEFIFMEQKYDYFSFDVADVDKYYDDLPVLDADSNAVQAIEL